MPKKPFYLSTAIAYPNSKPHIGFGYELIIADMISRWHKIEGEDVFLLTGLDEHGQKIQNTATAAGKQPRAFVDEQVVNFKLLCEKLNIAYSNFIRTTDKKHVKTALELFKKVQARGLIYKGTYAGLYCVGCEAFKTEKELVDGKCPAHLKAPEKVTEENYFFKLSQYQEQIINHIKNNPEFLQPESVRNEILNRLKEPLEDLSVSRTSFSWGIPVPGDRKHVIYVWFDALFNYLSGISYPTKKFQKYWSNAHHLIGRDIVWFHAVIWPAILWACDLPLPKQVFCHGMFTVNGQKMSKSLGNVIDPIDLIAKYGSDPVRYTFLRDVPAGQDGDFSESTLIRRNNAELADALGNLLQRTIVLLHKNFQGKIPTFGISTQHERELEKAIPNITELNTLMHNNEWHHVVEQIWNYVNRCNKYVAETEPWKQTDPARLGTILYTALEHLRIISILTWPVIPTSAEKIAAQIGQRIETFKDAKFKKSTQGIVNKPEILFKKIEQKKEIQKTPVTEDLFAKINLKVAKIEKVDLHPNADKLYVITLDTGSGKKQIVSGIRPCYPSPEQLLGKHIIFISNLAPANFRGVESNGMLLAGENEGVVRVVETTSAPGTQVTIEGVTPQTTQITIADFQKIKLRVQNKNVIYADKPLKTPQGPITVDLPDGATVR